MQATTEKYTQLQGVYKGKADEDRKEFTILLHKVMIVSATALLYTVYTLLRLLIVYIILYCECMVVGVGLRSRGHDSGGGGSEL